MAPSCHGDWRDDVVHFAREVGECYHLIGMSLSVTDAEETLIDEGFGLRDRENALPVDAETLFGIGSTTKAFTTTLAAALFERQSSPGWDGHVSDLIPALVLNQSEFSAFVSLRDLAAHRTSVPRNDAAWMTHVLSGGPPGTREDMTRALRWMNGPDDFRTRFIYNNWMYTTLGYATETIGGAKWEDLMKAELLGPIGMAGAQLFVDEAIESGNYAFPYAVTGPGPNDFAPLPRDINKCIEPMGPAGSLSASARDMAKWMRFHLRSGVTDGGQRLMSAEALLETKRPSMTVGSTPFHARPFFDVEAATWDSALGWFMGTYRGYVEESHTGGTLGHNTLVSMLPGGERGVFSSAIGGHHPGLAQQLIHWYTHDMSLGLEPWLTVESACNFPRQNQSATKLPSPVGAYDFMPSRAQWKSILDAAKALAEEAARQTGGSGVAQPGEYMHMAYGRLSISANGGGPLLFRLNDVMGELIPSTPPGYYTLLLDNPVYQLIFGTSMLPGNFVDPDGTITLFWADADQPPVFVRV